MLWHASPPDSVHSGAHAYAHASTCSHTRVGALLRTHDCTCMAELRKCAHMPRMQAQTVSRSQTRARTRDTDTNARTCPGRQ
eukprot:6199513-Pleurochrysis_carterae.AAC.2